MLCQAGSSTWRTWNSSTFMEVNCRVSKEYQNRKMLYNLQYQRSLHLELEVQWVLSWETKLQIWQGAWRVKPWQTCFSRSHTTLQFTNLTQWGSSKKCLSNVQPLVGEKCIYRGRQWIIPLGPLFCRIPLWKIRHALTFRWWIQLPGQ